MGCDHPADIDPERILRHPARPRILLGLHAEGPLSATELSRSRIGRGIPARSYDFHIKELVRFGLVRVSSRTPGNGRGVRYTVTERLTQPLLHAAALAAISEVLATIPPGLAQWLEQPYIDDIGELVRASRRQEGD
jgi:predicted ArsR family transcriptional regulator